MSDTHDERGGDADLYDWDPVYAAATIDRLQKALATETATCKRWLQRTVEFGKRAGNAEATCEDLREQLAAATARAEKAEAEVAGFGPACCVCGRILGYRNYRDQLFCWPCADGEPKTADAAPDGPSGPVERSEASGGSFQANTSSILPQGLSEAEPPRDTSAWCWAPNPNGPLHCGLLRDHEPPHRRGERTWTDDTTEDGQHG